MTVYDDSVGRDATVAGPAEFRPAAGPAKGLAHDAPPEPAPPDHVQHSAHERLDWQTGQLRTYGPDERVQR